MMVVMVGDKAQNYLPSPPIIVSSPVADILEVVKIKFPLAGHKRTAKCVQVKVVTMDSIFILVMLRIMHVT